MSCAQMRPTLQHLDDYDETEKHEDLDSEEEVEEMEEEVRWLLDDCHMKVSNDNVAGRSGARRDRASAGSGEAAGDGPTG
jgi:hypothetical protein